MKRDTPVVVRLDEVIAAGLRGDGVHRSFGGGDGDLNINLVHLDDGSTIAEHSNHEVDVLLVVLDGMGTLRVDTRDEDLVPNTVAYVPRGEPRSVTAGPDGLTYLTAHRARGQLRVT